jgi:hypothetical protein
MVMTVVDHDENNDGDHHTNDDDFTVGLACGNQMLQDSLICLCYVHQFPLFDLD